MGESIKTTLIDKVGAMGAYRMAKLLVRGLPRVLVYHRFGAHGCDANVFDAQMEILKDEFNVIPLSSLYRALSEGKEIEPHTVVITIDDGYADFREVAFPILKKYDLPATLYVVSDFVDRKTWLWPDVIAYTVDNTRHPEFSVLLNGESRRFNLINAAGRRQAWNDIGDHCLTLRNKVKLAFLEDLARALDVKVPEQPIATYASVTWQDLREMQGAGIDIGSHTCSHPKLTMVDPDELKHEVNDSKRRIEEMLQRDVEGFCYPNGSRVDLDHGVKEMVQRSGYLHATVGYHDSNVTADMYELGRFAPGYDLYTFKKVVYGVDFLRGL